MSKGAQRLYSIFYPLFQTGRPHSHSTVISMKPNFFNAFNFALNFHFFWRKANWKNGPDIHSNWFGAWVLRLDHNQKDSQAMWRSQCNYVFIWGNVSSCIWDGSSCRFLASRIATRCRNFAAPRTWVTIVALQFSTLHQPCLFYQNPLELNNLLQRVTFFLCPCFCFGAAVC